MQHGVVSASQRQACSTASKCGQVERKRARTAPSL